jgi:peptidyl-prolyl cis-trans isomerase C
MAISSKFWPRLALLAALSAGMSAPAFAEGETSDTVVASINGVDITLGHMAMLRDGLPQQYQALPDDVLFKGILEQLIQQAALAQSIEDKLSKREEASLANERRAFLAGAALQSVVAGVVTDEALQAAYDARFKDAAPQTEYNASHILVASEEEAAKLKAEIDAGADFAELAKVHSTDGAAAGGGSLGWFGLGMMVKDFEDAVVAMKVGEVAGPVKTDFGWHLVKLNETRIAAAPSLDEMRGELASEIEQAAVQARIEELTSAATITRSDEGIDPAALRDQTLFNK